LSVIYQTKIEWWQHYRNREDLDDERIAKVTLYVLSPWTGRSSSQNHHREALQYVRLFAKCTDWG